MEEPIKNNVRMYGNGPFSVAVVHGGPGAAGEMAPVARELSSVAGVLEPLQTRATLEGQVSELKAVLEEYGDLPVILIGFSWGAFLGLLLTARHPALVRKLILVGCGPLEEKDAATILQTRMDRLGTDEREELLMLAGVLQDPAEREKDQAFARLGTLLAGADAFDPLPGTGDPVECRYNIFRGVWEDARDLRRRGLLLASAETIRCPVVAIHGDHDPHPPEGVRNPLSRALTDFRFILLARCGHRPWIEAHARERFYAVLKNEIRASLQEVSSP